MEIDDKGGDIEQRYESFRRYWTWTWTWTKREQHCGIEKDQKSWTRKAHK
jgi:hypothetical protein